MLRNVEMLRSFELLRSGVIGLAAAAVVGGAGLSLAQPCSPAVSDTFLPLLIDGSVTAFLEVASSNGPASPPDIIVGGNFARAGTGNFTIPLANVARWDGVTYRALGAGLPGPVLALAEFDFGSGRQIVAGGTFPGLVQVWDGSAWSSLSVGGVLGSVRAIEVFDPDGPGPRPAALYATGLGGVARWNGAAWELVGQLTPDALAGTRAGGFALKSFDDGTGPRLFVGGRFVSAGGVGAISLARFDGNDWTTAGAGLSSGLNPGDARAFYVSRGELYVGGLFSGSGAATVQSVGRWVGGQWVDVAIGGGGFVTGVGSLPTSNGPQLYASLSDSPALRRVNAMGAWENVPQVAGSITNAQALLSSSDGKLLVGSLNSVNALRRFDGVTFDQLNNALQTVWNDPTLPPPQTAAGTPGMPELTGLFQAGKTLTGDNSLVARWTGRGWSAVGPLLFGTVNELAVHTDNAGPALYALGPNVRVTTSGVAGAARWTPATGWTAPTTALLGTVRRAKSLRVGGVDQLYITGSNVRLSPDSSGGVVTWNGTGFTTLEPRFTGEVTDIDVCDTGTGPTLHLAVNSLLIGTAADRFVVRYDNQQWTPLDAGVRGRANSIVVFDEGGGPALFAAGVITVNPANPGATGTGIFRWNGAAWDRFALVSGTSTTLRMAVFDDGGGEGLWVAGQYSQIGPARERGISFYRGGYWWPVALDNNSGRAVNINALPGPEPAIFFAGTLAGANSRSFTPTAEIRGCPRSACATDVDDGTGTGTLDGAVTIDDLTYYIDAFEAGSSGADIDDGTGRNVRDAAVTLDDLLFYLRRYDEGC